MLPDSYDQLAQQITPSIKNDTTRILLSELISILFEADDIIDISKNQHNFDSLIIYRDKLNLLYPNHHIDYYISLYINSTIIEDIFYNNFDISLFIETKIYNSGIFIVIGIINLELDINKIYYNEILSLYGIIISIMNDIISFNKESNEINPFNLFHICRYHNFKYQHILLNIILGFCIDAIDFYERANKQLCKICSAICEGYIEWSNEANRYHG